MVSLGVLCCSPVFSQQVNNTIKGKVTDEKNVAIPSGTVYLLKLSDSSLVKLALINDNGLFQFDNVKPGTYLVNISVIGFHKYLSSKINISQGETVDAGTVVLKKGASLRQLEITGSTNYVEVKPGKVILNVNKSVLSAGQNALDILSTAPGVQVGDDGGIKLKGKDVMIMINNRQVYLSPDALADLLRNTPGNTVAQIELMSNPNASYSAEGSGGIINIKMQRNRTVGISVSANGSYGITDINQQYGTRSKWSSGFTFDYNNENVSVFGGYSHTDNISQRLSVTDRAVYNPSLKQVHSDYLNDLNDRGNPFRLGMDYTIAPKQVIGFLINGVYSNYDYTKNTSTTTTVNGSPDSMFVSRSLTTRKLINYTLNLNYRASFGKLGDLSADADYSVYDRKPFETIYTDEYVLHPVKTRKPAVPPSYIQNTFPALYRIYTFAANDDIKLSKSSSLLASVKISYVTNDNMADFGNVINNTYQPDSRFTGKYDYNEQINAFGLTYSAALSKKANIEVGLRAEQTINHGRATSLTTTNPTTYNNYVDLFPSLQLTSNLDGNNQLSFLYGRRIRRPGYADLNPFVNYQDRYSYYIGNPDLKPQYTNNIELTNIYKQKYSVTLNASLINDYVQLTNLAGNIVSQRVNFGRNYNYGIQANAPVDITKWWNANLNVDAAIEHYDNSLVGNTFSVNATHVTFNFKQQFTFLQQFKAELLSIYESAHNAGFYTVERTYRFDAGVSKSIFKKKGSVQLQVFDIFNSYYTRSATNYQNLNLTGVIQNSFRTFQLSLIYSFGNKGKADQLHKLGSGDEQSRAGGGG